MILRRAEPRPPTARSIRLKTANTPALATIARRVLRGVRAQCSPAVRPQTLSQVISLNGTHRDISKRVDNR